MEKLVLKHSDSSISDDVEAKVLDVDTIGLIADKGDCILDEIVDELSDKTQPFDPLSFIPPQNVISNISKIYRFQKQLGKGASCRVVKAYHQNQKLYAIKEIPKNGNDVSFCKEIQLLKKLIHPNILAYHDCYMDDKNYYIATEYCSG